MTRQTTENDGCRVEIIQHPQPGHYAGDQQAESGHIVPGNPLASCSRPERRPDGQMRACWDCTWDDSLLISPPGATA